MPIRTLKEARAWRVKLESIAQESTDATASVLPSVFPQLTQNGKLIEVGTRINWNGVLKRAATDLWDTVDNNPDNAPTLWEDILYKDGVRIIPEVISTGTAFTNGELGWWDGVIYESTYDDANVWTPVQYPNGWKIKTEE